MGRGSIVPLTRHHGPDVRDRCPTTTTSALNIAALVERARANFDEAIGLLEETIDEARAAGHKLRKAAHSTTSG